MNAGGEPGGGEPEGSSGVYVAPGLWGGQFWPQPPFRRLGSHFHEGQPILTQSDL
jgi:hypothetical protein